MCKSNVLQKVHDVRDFNTTDWTRSSLAIGGAGVDPIGVTALAARDRYRAGSDKIAKEQSAQDEGAKAAALAAGEAQAADARRAVDASYQDAVKSRLATQRRRRGLSLLASAASGDESAPSTSRPAASAGKQQLGA